MPKGFASLTPERRRELAKKGGDAAKKKVDYKKIGKKGGLTTKEIYGKEYFQKVGKEGGSNVKKKNKN